MCTCELTGMFRLKENVIPGSDAAGTVLAVGEDIKNWKEGDRVCINFSLEHLDGDPTPSSKMSGLGAPIDGVLREYIVVPGYVSLIFTVRWGHQFTTRF
jgi:NADPH:quinone reductase-like Zn-dependent oxidoreductase